MHCVKSTVTIEDTIKKSRFIGIVIPCQSEKEIMQCLSQQHQSHPSASHIAFAYRIKTAKGIISRFNDAGEPSGTAGKPIYQHIEGNKNLINCLCMVIRYFGGIKLGAGGLTRAYGNTAKKAIDACSLNNYIEYAKIRIELDYKQMQNFEYQLKKLGGVIVKQDFSEKISLLVKLPEECIITLTEQFTSI